MNTPKTLFAAVIDLLPWPTLTHIFERHDNQRDGKSTTGADQAGFFVTESAVWN